MASLKTAKIAKSLTHKGFREVEGRDHIFYFFYLNGKKTSVFTKMSHSDEEIGDKLIKNMKNQMKLSKEQFFDFVKCTLTEEEYTKYLLDNGYIRNSIH